MKKSLAMRIRETFELGDAKHMTHIQNLEGIARTGEIRSYNFMRSRSYFNLANDDVQTGRSNIIINISNKPLHDYVPLYFGWKTPMVRRNQEHNDDILFLCISLNILKNIDVIFSDGNARADKTQFFLFKQLEDLKMINAKAINSVKWKSETDEFRRQKQAEILVPNKLLFSEVRNIICYSRNAQRRVLQILENYDIKKPVCINSGWYFQPTSQTSKTS